MIYLKNATYIDPITIEFVQGHIKVGEGIEESIEFIDELPALSPQDTLIDCTGKWVTQSFACGHHHAYSALATGMPAPKQTPTNFHEILQYVWWHLDKCLDAEIIEACALSTAISCAKNGTTFIIDHHASPFHTTGSLDILAKAFDRVGINHLLCYEISDRDGLEIAQQGLDLTEDYLGRNQGLVGLHASFTVGDETFRKAMEIATKFNSGIHIHVAEDQYDQEYCKDKYAMKVVDRLKDFGALKSSKTILAHCLHLNERQRLKIKKSPVFIVQNTDSNLNNRVGYFDSQKLGYNIMLGTDGMHSDMLRSAKAAYFTGQGHDSISPAAAYYRLRKSNEYVRVNDFKGDTENNLIILDYKPTTEFNSNNFLAHFIYSIETRHIQHVISSGKLIVEDRKIITVDENEITSFTQEQARRLWARMKG